MVLSIKSEKADQLARELAALTGESLTDAVVSSLEVRLEIERGRHRQRGLADILERFRVLPVLDPRAAEEILGYDEHGLPLRSGGTTPRGVKGSKGRS